MKTYLCRYMICCVVKSTLSLWLCALFCMIVSNAYAGSQKSNGFAQTIARDLIGQVIADPSETIFPDGWQWRLERGEVLSVDIKKAQKKGKIYVAIIIAHLKRGHLLVDMKMYVKYQYNGKKWVLKETTMKALNIPKQKDYSQYVRLYMDYDFLPTLMLKNSSDKNLFVCVELQDSDGKLMRQSHIVEPIAETSVCIGVVSNYRIVYAYQK